MHIRLVIQPIILAEDEIFPDISFMIPILSTLFGFDNKTVTSTTAISHLPKHLFDSTRNQYQSDHLLSWLQQTLQPSINTKLLALCSFDAYFGKYNFCFGEAIIGGRVAAVYFERLLPRNGNIDNNDSRLRTLFQERLVKEAVHELGHTFGLRHCSLDSCIMYKSKTISDTDSKNREFCEVCLNALVHSLDSTSK